MDDEKEYLPLKLPSRGEIEAYLNTEGHICLRQYHECSDDGHIKMCPHDVPIIIGWLQQLLDEIEEPLDAENLGQEEP